MGQGVTRHLTQDDEGNILLDKTETLITSSGYPGPLAPTLEHYRQLGVKPPPTHPEITHPPGGDHMTDTEEVRIKNETTGGEKGQKLERHDLLPVRSIRAIARHFGIGAKKYEDRNWERGYDWSLSYGALQRHLTAWWGGEDIDEETESSHLAAAGFHVLALLEFIETHPELDDRPTTKALQTAKPTPFQEAIERMISALGGAPVQRWVMGVEPEATGNSAGPHLHIEPEPKFSPGDRVRHRGGMDGTFLGPSVTAREYVSVRWDAGAFSPGQPARTIDTIENNLTLLEPAAEVGSRVSVRKIAKAIQPIEFPYTDNHVPEAVVMDHTDIVTILDALEDAGYQITYAPRA